MIHISSSYLQQSESLDLAHADERTLGLHLLQFPEVIWLIFLKIYFKIMLITDILVTILLVDPLSQVVEESCTNLLPNGLCEYLYNLSEDFTRFYTNCQVSSLIFLNDQNLNKSDHRLCLIWDLEVLKSR